MEKRFCDICKNEIKMNDTRYIVQISTSNSFILNDVCLGCVPKIMKLFDGGVM